MPDYYEILEIDKKATKDQIKAAYKRLALKYHPDRNLNNPYAEDVFKRINEAYQVLSDDLKRTYYDAKFNVPYTYPVDNQTTTNPNPYQTYNSNQNYQPYENSYDPKLYVSEKARKRIQIFTIVGLFFIVLGGVWLNFYMNGQTALQYYREALEMYKQNQKHAAIIRAGNAIHYKSNFYEAYLLRAKINEELKNYFKAWDDYDWIIRNHHQPTAEFYFLRGRVNLKRYEYLEAMSDLNQAVKLDNKQGEYYYYLALTKAETDKQKYSPTEICADWQKARQLYIPPKNELLMRLCE